MTPPCIHTGRPISPHAFSFRSRLLLLLPLLPPTRTATDMDLLRRLFASSGPAAAKKAPRFSKETVNQEVLNARYVRVCAPVCLVVLCACAPAGSIDV